MNDLSTAVSLQSFAPIWVATRPDRRRIKVCGTHLMTEPDLRDIAPASSGHCVVCREPVTPSRHAVERWLQRVKPGTPESAGLAIIEFASDAVTADSPPRWVSTLDAAIEVVLNDRRPGVALLKKRRPGQDPIIVTIITEDLETGRRR